jgi:hypothetical protein
MLLGFDQLGEQTLNRIAEMALSSQLDGVDDLTVRIKTNLDLLAKGQLESMLIDGQGLVMQQDLRMQQMTIRIGQIAVNPMTALLGNIQLTQPTQGTAHIMLSAADLTRAFNSDVLHAQMQGIRVQQGDETTVLDVQDVACQLLDSGELVIRATVWLRRSQEHYPVEFRTVPKIVDNGRRVHLDDIRYCQGQDLPPTITQALVQRATQVLDLKNFEMNGIELRLQHLTVTAAALTLDAIAHVTRFPKV